MAELTLRERCSKRLAGLKTLREPYESDWREIARHAQPARSRWLNTEKNKNTRQTNKNIYDSHSIQAFRTLAAGMTSGMSSPSRPWFKLETYDTDVMDSQAVKEYLTETERRMYAFLAGTNFYGAARFGYSELGLFGTEACVMLEDRKDGAVCHALTAGEYWISTGTSVTADTLYRRVPLTVAQAVNSFGKAVSERVMRAYDASGYDEIVNVFHAIEPNTDREPRRLDARGKPWRSVWWDEDTDAQTTLRVGGFEEQPFWAPRWEVTGSDAWGQSPGMQALPDMRELQMQCKRKAEATDFHIYPEMVADAKIRLKRIPKAVTSVASFDQTQVNVPYSIPYQSIAALGADIERLERKIDVLAYADLFMAITNMEGVQPRNQEEILSRNEEKMTQLGSVIDNVNKEKLQIAIDRAFGIMERGGLLPEAPEELQGRELKTEFVSILTQMQRMVGLGQIERTFAFVGNVMGAFPEAGDKLNVDETIDEYADRAGTPAKLIRSDEDVAKIRAQRAQQAQMDKMAQMAQPAQQAADAARLMSETALNGAQLPAAPL